MALPRSATTWIRFTMVLLATFVHCGFGPGTPMIFNSLAFPGKIFSYRCGGDSVLGGIAKRIAEVGGMPAEQILEIFLKFVPAMAPMAMIPEPFACDYEYSALTGTFIIGYTLSMLMLFPALVLVDRYGPRFIASLGSILNFIGMLFIPIAFLMSWTGQQKLLWPTMYISFFLSETGARLVGAGLHGFVWHLEGHRRKAFIIIAVLFNLQALMGLLFQQILTAALSDGMKNWEIVQGYYGLLLVGTFVILACTPARKEYKEMAGEVLGTPFPEWDFSKSKYQHVKTCYRYARDVLKMSYIRNMLFGFTVVCMTSWVTLYKCMASVYAYDMWAGDIVEDFGSILPSNFTGLGTDGLAFPKGRGMDGVQSDMSVGQVFAESVIWITALTSIVVMIAGQALVDIIGMSYIMLFVCVAQYFASSYIYTYRFDYQALVSMCAGITLGGSYVLIGKHMAGYAPPKAIASVTTLFYFCVAGGSLILILFSITFCQFMGLPSAFSLMTNISFFITLVYTVICFWYGEPTTCVLGPGEELKACRLYACKSINEVLYVTGFDNLEAAKQAPVTIADKTKKFFKKAKKGKKAQSPWEVMQNMLASSEPTVQTAIVRSIRPDRMEEKLMKLANQEILDMVKEGLVWETGAKKTFQGTTGGFAITPQLWSQFWRQTQDVSMLTPPQQENGGTADELTSTVSTLATNGNGNGKYVQKQMSDKEVKWKKDMLRSLNARQHTKELAKILRQGDRATLQEWLLSTNVDNIVAAVWDMALWDKAVENAVKEEETYTMHMTDMFNAMFPLDSLSSLMLQRPSFKPVVVECMKRDLIKAQTNLEKAAAGTSGANTGGTRGSFMIVNALTGSASAAPPPTGTGGASSAA